MLFRSAESKQQLKVRSLNLSNAKFGAEVMDFMTNSFSRVFPNLTELVLANATVPKGATLVPVLRGLNFLVNLDVSGLTIRKNTVTEISKLILSLNNLKQLHMRDSTIPASVLKEIVNSIKGTGVALDLAGSQLDAECADVLAECLRISKNITSLDVSDTPLKDAGLTKILNALIENTAVETLNISRVFGGDGREALMTALTRYLKKTTSLTSLTMVGGTKQDQQLGLNMIPVFNAIVKNDRIVSLDVQSQGMGNKGAFALANLVKITTSLQSLKWDENQTGMFGIRAIIDAMRVNTSVKELQLPILDCRALQVRGEFGNVRVINELVKSLQTKN